MIPNHNLIYLFHIKSINGKDYYLTSGNIELSIDNKIYSPRSGINILHAEYNDSGENQIIIGGIYEDQAILRNDNLVGSSVKIMYLKDDKLHHFVTYFCTEQNISDLHFEIKCEPETIKYNKSILLKLSKTCRANLGDTKCKVNIDDYKISANFTSITRSGLICKTNSEMNFSNGFISMIDTENHKYKFKILSHINDEFQLQGFVNRKYLSDVVITPSCDKTIRTCCDYFNNAVNFRGEPNIPDFNTVETL